MKLLYQEVSSCVECFAYHSEENIFCNVDGHCLEDMRDWDISPRCPLPEK